MKATSTSGLFRATSMLFRKWAPVHVTFCTNLVGREAAGGSALQSLKRINQSIQERNSLHHKIQIKGTFILLLSVSQSGQNRKHIIPFHHSSRLSSFNYDTTSIYAVQSFVVMWVCRDWWCSSFFSPTPKIFRRRRNDECLMSSPRPP
jgi:hypothetical protein